MNTSSDNMRVRHSHSNQCMRMICRSHTRSKYCDDQVGIVCFNVAATWCFMMQDGSDPVKAVADSLREKKGVKWAVAKLEVGDLAA